MFLQLKREAKQLLMSDESMKILSLIITARAISIRIQSLSLNTNLSVSFLQQTRYIKKIIKPSQPFAIFICQSSANGCTIQKWHQKTTKAFVIQNLRAVIVVKYIQYT